MDIEPLKKILEGALLAAGKPLDLAALENLFTERDEVDRNLLDTALEGLADDCAERSYQLRKVASGYRLQVRQELAPWINNLWEEKPKKYSRAVLETLSLIAYRQPITRGDIEQIRGVAVSSDIIRSLEEREWIRVVGHRDVPGRPALFATTRQFLDYFDLRTLNELPPLSEIRDIEEINAELGFGDMTAAVQATDQDVGRELDQAANNSRDVGLDIEIDDDEDNYSFDTDSSETGYIESNSTEDNRPDINPMESDAPQNATPMDRAANPSYTVDHNE